MTSAELFIPTHIDIETEKCLLYFVLNFDSVFYNQQRFGLLFSKSQKLEHIENMVLFYIFFPKKSSFYNFTNTIEVKSYTVTAVSKTPS